DREKRVQTFDEVADRLLASLPELEHSPLRLPSPAGTTADPDATNALPVVRPSDRPPPLSLSASGGGTNPPWATTPGGLSTRTVSGNTVGRGGSSGKGALFAVAAFLLGALLVATAVGSFLILRRTRAAKPAPAPPKPDQTAVDAKPRPSASSAA